MSEVELRLQRLSDAKRFFKILSNPNFVFFGAKPKSIEAEKEWLKKGFEKRKKNLEHNYAITYDGKLIGGCGIKINQHRTFIGEIGYFVDEAYWGKGVATKATKLLEKIAFKMDVKRIEIVMQLGNKGSVKVAKKCGYVKEGKLRKAISHLGKYEDVYLYSKVK